jgi:peptidoglycan/xylan/chitin deacetylase (PgdA/CDA1 family)
MQTIHALSQKPNGVQLMQGNDFLHALDTNCFPWRIIWIFTSDDGWEDTYTDLVPIATANGVPFFLGIIAGKLDSTGFVSRAQLQELSQNPLVTISSHSIHHTNQAELSAGEEKNEICDSKKILEELIQKPVMTFIYPIGRINQSSSMQNLKSCGYTLAWSTSFGKEKKFVVPNGDRLQINRIRIGHDTQASFFWDLLVQQQAHLSPTGTSQP